MVYPYTGILFNHKKKNSVLIHAMMWMSLGNMACEKPDTKDHILYDFVNMKYPGR